MEVDQMAGTIDKKAACVYCSADLKDAEWESVHSGIQLYKRTNCPECNKVIMLKAGFDGSGHDDWAGKKEEKPKGGVRSIDLYVMTDDGLNPKK